MALAHIHTSADAIVARADGRRASEGHGVQKAPRCDEWTAKLINPSRRSWRRGHLHKGVTRAFSQQKNLQIIDCRRPHGPSLRPIDRKRPLTEHALPKRHNMRAVLSLSTNQFNATVWT